MSRVLGLLAIMIVALLPATVSAQGTSPAWVLLHSERIAAAGGTQRLQLQNAPLTRALRLAVTEGQAEVSRVVVTFGNGQVHFEPRPIRLAAGEQARPIAESDEALVVASVSVELKTVGPASAAMIQVWGLRSDIGAIPPRPRAATAQADPGKGFSELAVYYGTMRQREADRVKNQRQLATFSGEAGKGLTLGRAMVTIPIEREVGSIPRPEFDFIVARVAFRNEDPKRDFTLAAVDVMERGQFIGELRRSVGQAKVFRGQAFVFVHGYNVGFDTAIFRTAQIAHDIGFDGPPIAFSWPSRGGTWDYRHDVDTAKASRDGLLQLLELIARESGVESVNVIAHSMGNDPLLEVLGKQGDVKRAGGTIQDLKLKEVILAAPDVSRRAFEQLAEKFKGLARGGVTLYASANDKAMTASKKVASGLVRAGDVPSREGPTIVEGIETIDITNASTSFFATNHSAFADRQHLVEDMRLLFQSSKHPPDQRFPIFRPQNVQSRLFWRYMSN